MSNASTWNDSTFPFRYCPGVQSGLFIGDHAWLVNVAIEDPLMSELAASLEPGIDSSRLEALMPRLEAAGFVWIFRSGGMVHVRNRGARPVFCGDEEIDAEADVSVASSTAIWAGFSNGPILPASGGLMPASAIGLVSTLPSSPAAPVAPSAPAAAAVDFPVDLDHTHLGRGRDFASPGVPAVAVVEGVHVHAVQCQQGHYSPPHLTSCRVCNLPIVRYQAQVVPRPPLGWLILPDGQEILLDRDVVFGRKPRKPNDLDGEPLLHSVHNPDRDVSMQHFMIKLDYWNVLAVDLGSTNGTWVTPIHSPRMKLLPNEPLTLDRETVIDLAEVFPIRFVVA